MASEPLPPSTVSFPPKPFSTSFPSPPQILSLPDPPIRGGSSPASPRRDHLRRRRRARIVFTGSSSCLRCNHTPPTKTPRVVETSNGAGSRSSSENRCSPRPLPHAFASELAVGPDDGQSSLESMPRRGPALAAGQPHGRAFGLRNVRWVDDVPCPLQRRPHFVRSRPPALQQPKRHRSVTEKA